MKRLAPVAGATVAVLLVGGLVLVVLLTGPGSGGPRNGGSGDGAGRDGAGSAPTVDPDADPVAVSLLRRAAEAPQRWAYRGTQYASAWEPGTDGRVVTLEVSHEPLEGTEWRDSKGELLTAGAPGSQPSLLGSGAVGLLSRHYTLRATGQEEVAGRPAAVVTAYPPSSSAAGSGQAAARFWVDDESGLVLRREVYDASGEPTRTSVFVDIDLWREVGPNERYEAEDGRPWRTAMDADDVARMRDYGWDCPRRLPGRLSLVDARRSTPGGGSPVVHLSYADGIRSISVFLQHGALGPESVRGFRRTDVSGNTVWVRDTVPREVMWSSGDRVYVVLGDAPRRTVDRAVVRLHERADQGGGAVDRLGRGLDRVASWFNPFE